MPGLFSNNAAQTKKKPRKYNKKQTGFLPSLNRGLHKFANSTVGKATGTFVVTTASFYTAIKLGNISRR